MVEAKRKGLILAVKPMLHDLIATAEFRVADALYARILEIDFFKTLCLSPFLVADALYARILEIVGE